MVPWPVSIRKTCQPRSPKVAKKTAMASKNVIKAKKDRPAQNTRKGEGSEDRECDVEGTRERGGTSLH